MHTLIALKDRPLMNMILGLDSFAFLSVMELYGTTANDWMILLKWDLALQLLYPLPSELVVNVF